MNKKCFITKLNGIVSENDKLRKIGELRFTVSPLSGKELCILYVSPKEGMSITVKASTPVVFKEHNKDNATATEQTIVADCYIESTAQVTYSITRKYDIKILDFCGYLYQNPCLLSEADSFAYTGFTEFNMIDNSTITNPIVDTDSINVPLSKINIKNSKNLYGEFKNADITNLTEFTANGASISAIDLSKCIKLNKFNVAYSDIKLDISSIPSTVTECYIDHNNSIYGDISTFMADTITNISCIESDNIVGEVNNLALARKNRAITSNFTVALSNGMTFNGEYKYQQGNKNAVQFTYSNGAYTGEWILMS